MYNATLVTILIKVIYCFASVKRTFQIEIQVNKSVDDKNGSMSPIPKLFVVFTLAFARYLTMD